MKIGLQTIVWWPFKDELEYILEVIAVAGFQGVEFRHRPDQLGDIEQLLKLFSEYKYKDRKGEEHELELIGLSGGSLKKRMDFCGDNFRPKYLLTNDWNEEIVEIAAERNFTLGLHPRIFKPVRGIKDAQELFKKDPNLKFLPDIAHLNIVGDDPVEVIKLFKDRIVGVHFKDWTPEFGRSVHRYARGFVELGEGEVDLDGVLNILQDIGYEGWLIVEQDWTRVDSAISTFECAKWLAERGLLPAPPAKPPKRKQVRVDSRYAGYNLGGGAEAHFLERVVSAGWLDVESCYESIAKGFLEFCNCKLVGVWICSPAHEFLDLVAVYPDPGISLKAVLSFQDALSGETIEQQRIRDFDLTDPEVRRRFGYPELLEVIKPRRMVSVPVFNPWNPNHVRLVVNIFHDKDRLAISNEGLEELAVAVGHSTSSALDGAGSTLAAKVNVLVGKSKHVEDFVKGLTVLIAKTIDCKEVAILLTTPSGNELELLGYVGEEWMSGGVEEWYKVREEPISRVWDTKETLILPKDSQEVKEEEIDLEERAVCATTPFVKVDGTVLGLIYCCNKRTPHKLGTSKSFVFSDDDAAILEVITQAAVPHLELMAAQDRQVKMLGRLTHELKVPLVAIRGAVDFIKRTEGVNKFFDYDYPGDIWSWSELMGRLVDNADAFRYSTEGIQIKVIRTYLLGDVIAPAIRQVRLLLRERGFSPLNINYTKEKFQQLPALWLDQNQFQQLMFNLLSNAIKYADENPNAFRVEIEGVKREVEFVIWFRDWGPGIEADMEAAIFEEGFRGQNAINQNVTGPGLGLWIVRQIIERHGGSVKVSKLKFPTEFEITLPSYLTVCPSMRNLGD